MRLLADSSPDTSLPSFKEMLQRHKSQLADRVSVDVDPSRATADLAAPGKGMSELRAGPLRRVTSQPDERTAAKRKRLQPPPTNMFDVIELTSDSVVDPPTSQETGRDDFISSPILMTSSQPLPKRSKPISKTVSAPVFILSSSPPPSQTGMRANTEMALPSSSLPLPPSSPGRRSSPIPIHDSPTRKSPRLASRFGAGKTAQRTRSLLDALDELHVPNGRSAGRSISPEPLFFASQSTDGGGASQPNSTKSAGAAKSAKRAVSPPRPKAAKETAKEAREAKARKRELAKQAKLDHAEERKRWKEANRLRSSKTETMKEMFVDMDSGLFAPGQPLATCKNSIKARLEEEGAAQVCFKDTIISPPLIRFRRKVKAVWNTDRRHWMPLDREEIVDESTTIVYVDAKEIVDLVASKGLVVWYDDLRKRLLRSVPPSAEKDFQIFLVVQGLIKYYAKIKANENRVYAARIRNQLAQEAGGAAVEPVEAESSRAVSKSKAPAAAAAPQDEVERALLQLKFLHRCYVIHVGALIDGVEWIHQLTSDISIRPYKALRDSHLTFSVDSRNTTANDNSEIWSMMLQQIPRVTASIAASITTVYPTLPSLVKAYKQCPDQLHQNQLLSTIQIATNVDGTERRGNRTNLGLQLSKRICAVLQNRNPELLINNPTKD